VTTLADHRRTQPYGTAGGKLSTRRRFASA
jgi:hypothetical protein